MRFRGLFSAEATLFAGQYITTFDGRHLNYKATCSYLLARDFVDGNFSVVANFDADRRAKTLKSLSLTTAHNEQVQIFPSNKVDIYSSPFIIILSKRFIHSLH